MNRCEKYSDWITDSATGGLAPNREPELLAHAAECDACREAYNHAREIAAFVDRGVESLVSAEPSAQFHTRLRARIAAERIAARPNWAGWAPMAAGVFALAALLLILVLRTQRPNSPSIANNTEPASLSLQPSNRPSPSTTQNSPAAPNARRRTTPKHPKSPSQPEIIVPPGQLAAITQFAAAIRSGHIDGDKLLAAEEQTNAPLEIKPLEIVPLVPPQPDVAPDATEDSGRP
jgi:anti-sigma factor RsiW